MPRLLIDSLRSSARRLLPAPVARTVRRAIAAASVERLHAGAPGAYRLLARLAEPWSRRRVASVAPELAGAVAAESWPGPIRAEVLLALARLLGRARRADAPHVRADVLFASAASPDLVKHGAGLRRSDPHLRRALLARGLPHVARLASEVFDDVSVVGSDAEVLGALARAEADVLVLRTRQPLELLWAAHSWPGRVVYCPPGFFLNSVADQPPSSVQGIGPEAAALIERTLLRRADAVVHFLSDDAVDEMRRRGLEIGGDVRLVYAGCMPELGPASRLPKLSEADGGIHLVHATGVAPPGSDARFGRYAQHHLKWPTILDQGIHIHAYFSHIDYADPRWRVYRELAEAYPNFHLEPQIEFDELLTELTRYDFALKHWDMRGRAIRPEHMRHLTTNFFAYLQAGLPMIVSETMVTETEVVADLGIGVVVPEGDLVELRAILESLDRDELARRVVAAAERFAYDDDALHRAVVGRERSRV